MISSRIMSRVRRSRARKSRSLPSWPPPQAIKWLVARTLLLCAALRAQAWDARRARWRIKPRARWYPFGPVIGARLSPLRPLRPSARACLPSAHHLLGSSGFVAEGTQSAAGRASWEHIMRQNGVLGQRPAKSRGYWGIPSGEAGEVHRPSPQARAAGEVGPDRAARGGISRS